MDGRGCFSLWSRLLSYPGPADKKIFADWDIRGILQVAPQMVFEMVRLQGRIFIKRGERKQNQTTSCSPAHGCGRDLVYFLDPWTWWMHLAFDMGGAWMRARVTPIASYT